jgi:cysteine desulfurase
MDCHATTPLDQRVLEAMLPYFTERFGNAGSISHAYGQEALAAVDAARQSIANCLGADPKEIVFTSGATESNNLAIRGVTDREPRRGDHVVTVATEHRSVLDPFSRLARRGWNVTYLGVASAGRDDAGVIDLDELDAALRPGTLLVSVMLANNEIGVIQPVSEIARRCKRRGIILHCDAAQAVGKIDVNVRELGADLVSFSAHKIHGPKGIGALFVRRGTGVKLVPQIDGGGQERGLRSGTLNVPGIVGFARALALAVDELPHESQRLRNLRDELYAGLCRSIRGVRLNGPALHQTNLRLPGNLNVQLGEIDGDALMARLKLLAVSSGSACTTADPEPSHVLRALGLSETAIRGSLRFGLGRLNTAADVQRAVELLAEGVACLRSEA